MIIPEADKKFNEELSRQQKYVEELFENLIKEFERREDAEDFDDYWTGAKELADDIMAAIQYFKK